jgi:acetyltransferase-like isoleucine patch superfamily enzyme
MADSRSIGHGGASRRPMRMARYWARFWCRWNGPSVGGRLASRLAALFYPPHLDQVPLAYLWPRGYIDSRAVVYHSRLQLEAHVYLAPRVLIFQHQDGGAVSLGEKVAIHRDARLETGQGGSIRVEPGSSIHPGCQLLSFIAPIVVGEGVMIAANAALYSYDHGMAPDVPIRKQPLGSKGPITIGDDAWIGTGAVILSGVTIGKGAVVAAGSVVTRDIPDNAIAAGNPARVIKFRSELQQTVGIDE